MNSETGISHVARDFRWSHSEKAIARKAFQRALDQELQSLIRETKRKAGKIVDPSELWALEKYLSRRRTEIDRKYDFRYSVLPLVFGLLIREGAVTEENLIGLSSDKMDYILQLAKS